MKKNIYILPHKAVLQPERGCLHILERHNLPFIPRRVFWIKNVPKLGTRGGHAHIICQQYLFALAGEVKVTITDGHSEDQVVLKHNSSSGLYVPEMYWLETRFLQAKTVLLVLASHEYDESDYIRDFDQYKELMNASGPI